MAIRRHTLDIYGTELYLATTSREWKKLRKELPFLDKRHGAGEAHFADGHLAIWVDVAAHEGDLDLIDTAAHEATHGVAGILQYIGHNATATDEPTAYLVGWLTRWIVEGVRA